jgi:predicted DNA-binding transcriptional regulator YafY
MNRIDRLHAILTVLQSKRVVKAEELATRFNISLRTVYRDLRALEEGGIPIGAEAGVGYYLTDGFHLPPVMFTNEEARALLMAGKLVEKNTDEQTFHFFTNALTKVRAVLDTQKKEDLDGLENKILVNPFATSEPSQEDLRINELKHALSLNKVIRIEYSSLGSKEKTNRDLEPIGLTYYYGKWHLIAYCRLRKAYRDFRLDRIESLTILSETFLRIKHPSIKEYMDNLMKEAQLINAVIKVHESMLPYIQNSKYHMGLINEKVSGEWTEMNFATYSIEYFSKWILTMGTKVEIISPINLREQVRDIVRDLAAKYALDI